MRADAIAVLLAAVAAVGCAHSGDALNDPELRRTNFVIVHGGGAFAREAGALLWKPNVYVDISAMVLIYPPAMLAQVMRGWLSLFPEKVLFGSDAAAFGPGIGWDVAAQLGTSTARRALAIALSEMMRNGELTRARAEQIAAMVMRTNAASLYHLNLSWIRERGENLDGAREPRRA